MRKISSVFIVFIFCCSLFLAGEAYAWFGKSSKKSPKEELSSSEQKVEKKISAKDDARSKLKKQLFDAKKAGNEKKVEEIKNQLNAMYKKKTPKGETSIEIPTAKKKAPHFMIDTNKDGVISEAEKKTWIKKKELKHYDLNKDGKVTDKEREETQRKLKDKRATREKKKEEVAKKVEESRKRIDPIKYLQEKLANTKDSEKRKRINDKIKKYKAKKK